MIFLNVIQAFLPVFISTGGDFFACDTGIPACSLYTSRRCVKLVIKKLLPCEGKVSRSAETEGFRVEHQLLLIAVRICSNTHSGWSKIVLFSNRITRMPVAWRKRVRSWSKLDIRYRLHQGMHIANENPPSRQTETPPLRSISFYTSLDRFFCAIKIN